MARVEESRKRMGSRSDPMRDELQLGSATGTDETVDSRELRGEYWA